MHSWVDVSSSFIDSDILSTLDVSILASNLDTLYNAYHGVYSSLCMMQVDVGIQSSLDPIFDMSH